MRSVLSIKHLYPCTESWGTMQDAKPGLIAMGSCVATAAVTASLRAKRAALQDPSVPIKRPKRKSGLLQEVWAKQSEPPTLKFDNLLSIAKQLQGREPISPQLYEVLSDSVAPGICAAVQFTQVETAQHGL